MLACKEKNNVPRWKAGERLHHLFEARCDELYALGGNVDAVSAQDATYSFRDLDDRANRLARHLIGCGVRPGDRIGLIFDKGFDTYVALLAVLKANAAYVPLDPGFPNDRIGFILEDAEARFILSMSAYAEKLQQFQACKVFLDTDEAAIDAQPAGRLSEAETGAPKDQLAYIIYTSGTTGKPKGVAIDHPSICNFVRVAAEEYGMSEDDRCYQGMTIAFDFSVEELWVPLLAGATLVPARPGATLVGDDLADFLIEERVTAWACVPTLLATIEKDLPDLRVLLLSGEACPPNLVSRWYRPGRSILNVYGPTEATVTATMTEVYPDKPVTIGSPLPTYTVVILDPEKPEEVADGELGELGIAGIGLAAGYLNRPDLTEQKFIPDFIGIPHNPSGRIYRSGDLARINADGEIEFHGRIDTQVKIRGYRIELTEIESLLMEFPQVAQAVVDKYEPEPGAVELVAYYSLNQGAEPLEPGDIRAALKGRLPCYMIPAFFEELPVIPMTTSNKADRKSLPAPKGPRFSGSSEYVAPRSPAEEMLAAALAKALNVERVSIADNFFKDLGAHSLLMARFCSDIRKQAAFGELSMRDVYMHPTVEALAAHLGASLGDTQAAPALPRPERLPLRIPTNLEYYGTGALQAAFYAAYGLLFLWTLKTGFHWTYAGVGNTAELYLRIVAFAAASVLGFTALPIAAKWLLIGRFKQEVFPIWSLKYFRFWMVRSLTRSAPPVLLKGTPLYNLYLRLLGARIGRNVVIEARHVPDTPDLFSLGDDTILRHDVLIMGYKAESGYIRTGSVTIGSNCYVGDASVLDIDTVMEDGTQLGHASSLQSGQRALAGRRYHGSPAVETATNFCRVERMDCTPLRRWVYSAAIALPGLLVLAPAAVMLVYKVFPYLYQYTGSAEVDLQSPGMHMLALAAELAALTFAAFIAAIAVALATIALAPRLLNRLLKEDRTYVLFGFHYYVHKLIGLISNSGFFNLLLGDSSFVVHYLKYIGWNLNTIEQTGSNFGTDQKQDNPFLCDVGTGTIVSDGLSMNSAETSSSSFKLRKVKIGARNFLGNNIQFPAGAATGANVLLGTKVMVPIDGPVREDVGLLGSPAFEIPRAVDADTKRQAYADPAVRRERIRRKNIYNLKTVALSLLSNWAMVFAALFGLYVAALYYPLYGMLSLAAYGVGLLAVAIAHGTFGVWASTRFRRLRPQSVSIYDDYFWMHERYWKFYQAPVHHLFRGTPFRNVLARLAGVKVGRKVFDDGCHYVEKSLVEVGDYASLNERAVLQGHSLEEGIFKSDHIRVGAGCSLGPATFVHYGVTLGENVIIDPDSFLMKGETAEASSIWQGNPARAVVTRVAEPALAVVISIPHRRRLPVRPGSYGRGGTRSAPGSARGRFRGVSRRRREPRAWACGTLGDRRSWVCRRPTRSAGWHRSLPRFDCPAPRSALPPRRTSSRWPTRPRSSPRGSGRTPSRYGFPPIARASSPAARCCAMR